MRIYSAIRQKNILENRHLSADLPKVGEHFIIGLQKSVKLTDHDERLLSALRPAGIILFRENFKYGVPYEDWISCLRELLDRIRACVGRNALIVSIDHEGGAVFRPPPPIANFGPGVLWASNSAEVGAAMGIELRSLGVNLNYAPGSGHSY